MSWGVNMKNLSAFPGSPASNVSMSDRESSILLSLAKLRFMTTGQLHRLHGYAGRHGISVTRRKLTSLERVGWVKSWQPSKYDQKVFYLSKHGALELAYRLGEEGVRSFRRSEKALHYVLIAEAFVSLGTAEPGALRTFDVEPRRGRIIPDAYLEYLLDDRLAALFLEVDRNTESAAYLRDVKMEKYRCYYEERQISETLAATPSLLIVTLTDYRKRLLQQIAGQLRIPCSCSTADELTLSPVDCLRRAVLQAHPDPKDAAPPQS